jgi:Mg2+-importing ATPase
VATALVTLALPYSPLAGTLGLVGVPMSVLAALGGLTAVYVVVNEVVKRRTGLAA